MWSLRPRIRGREIDPDEIFIDSSNLPHLDASQFEGRVEHPVGNLALFSVGLVFALGALLFIGRAFGLQVMQGDVYAEISRENRLERSIIFAERGILNDRNGVAVAWNEAPSPSFAANSETGAGGATTSAATTSPYTLRAYFTDPGLSHLIGFVRYPKQDSSGKWWREDYSGVSGLELALDERLRGENGSRMVETDARGDIKRQHIVIPPEKGEDIILSIDAGVQSRLYELLSAHAANNNFKGGAAVIIDVKTGEILALTSFPEYDHAEFSAGNSDAIRAANVNAEKPLLNRAIAGVYVPGSIVKPIFAAAALEEGIIDPETEILSTGQLIVPNPYDPSKPSVFKDWRAHGWVDMRRAIAVSSDVYFYTIGGGFGAQKGLGIELLEKYARVFGLGTPTGIPLIGEAVGVIPTPAWKAEVFGAGDPWRIGDTYITAIGQFGFKITPIQAARYAAAIANGGVLVTPQLVIEESGRARSHAARVSGTSVGISDDKLAVIRDGMRFAVTDGGTASALNIFGISLSGKTGTAQVGDRNQFMNSWVIGFWPAENPRFAFAVVMERAPAGTLSGAAPAMRQFFEWLVVNKPEYLN